YQPLPKGSPKDAGKVRLFSDVDNFRLAARLYAGTSVKAGYAFQSFQVSSEGAATVMRPGFYVNSKTGRYLRSELQDQAIGTSCIKCHGRGSRLAADELVQMEQQDYRSMKGLEDFVSHLKFGGAGNKFLSNMRGVLEEKGPASLLPLE